MMRPVPVHLWHEFPEAVIPPQQHSHAASVSNRGSRYLRPRPQCVEVTCQPYWRAEASLAANQRCGNAARLAFNQVIGSFQSLLRSVRVVRCGISATSLWSRQAAGWWEGAGPVLLHRPSFGSRVALAREGFEMHCLC